MKIRIHLGATRRKFLATGAAATALTTIGGIARPIISRATDRPIITHGLQSGDVSIDAGVVWARADRPSRMQSKSPPLTASKTFTAVLMSTRSRRAISQPSYWSETCRLDKTSSTAFDFKISSFQRFSASPWSDDSAPHHATGALYLSSGRVIKQVRDGVSTNRAAACAPTLPCSEIGLTFLSILAITSMPTIRSLPEVKLPNGEIWKNIVIEEKTKSAQTLAEFRGNWKYNLLDKNLLAFNAEIPTFSQWDDHEILNNWWPGEPLTRAVHQRRKYVEKNTSSCWPALTAPCTNICL